MNKIHPLPSSCTCKPRGKPHYRLQRMVHIAQVIHQPQPSIRREIGTEREYIPKVFGASPAIVFDPHPDTASITRPFKARKVNRGWQKMQAIMNGAADHLHGYDDGEFEPQTRGVHV